MTLETKDIGFCYTKNKWILRDVNLSFDEHSRTALTGESGAGKTTLAKLLAAWIQPVCGAVLLDNKPFIAKTQMWRPVQLISQHPEKALNPRWKMREALAECYGANGIGASPLNGICEKMGIDNAWLERYPRELSAGEMQRFCIVRALYKETRFIIADEISAMFDALSQARIWMALLDECRKRSIGIMVITHDTALAEKVCNNRVSIKAEGCFRR